MSAEVTSIKLNTEPGTESLQRPTDSGPQPVVDSALAALQLLLRVENEARDAKDVQADPDRQ